MKNNFYISANGKTYEIEMQCRVLNEHGAWETANMSDIPTDCALNALRADTEDE